MQAVRDIVERCYKHSTFLKPEFSKHDSAVLLEAAGPSLSPELFDYTFSLLKKNMQDKYGDDWSDEEKEEELKNREARFLVATREANLLESAVGYVHFRFVEEEGVPVLYIYELQLEEANHRRGLGRWLMKVSEEIGRAHGMSGIVLTCFKHNPAALAFYRALGYVPAPHSPSRCTVEHALPRQPHLHTLVQQEQADYEILCKMWSEEAIHTLEAVAEESRQELAAMIQGLIPDE